MLVLTFGNGTHAFTLDPHLGEWILSHKNLQIPAQTREFAINASNSRFWEPAVKRYVDECLAGNTGPRGRDFNMRWIASLVAETHRILMRGGVVPVPARQQGREQGRPAAAAVRGEPDLVPDRAGRRQGQHRPPPRARAEADRTAPARGLHLRLGRRGGGDRGLHQEDLVEGGYRSPLFATRGLFAAI